ncbi:MAG: B12-binding domain-containing radical SAM protein [Holophagaceae bacterium]|uniref:B12-binding domain-containing radical SAM protein n=1 Tax=Candidatus Geothrix skivensis TaxID=2954439 RepID=A0A9D7SGX3_9BACT|nr:B12-binding domain-containing radical SAM protein [Candidatus Geothrix skivensis]
MKKKVVLFFPETHLSRAEDGWCLPPFSLLAIAGPLLQEGYEVVLVDGRLVPDFLERVQGESANAICLGISVLTGNQIRQALELSAAIKERFPDLPVVWGGYHPTLLPDQTIANPLVDVVVRGQGELTFKRLVQALASGASLRGIPGLSFKEPGRIVCNDEAPFTDVNEFPPMPFSLVDLSRHLPDLGFARRTLSYVTSQGCPHHCEFCAESTAYKVRWSGLAPARVAQDLEALLGRCEADGVILVDNNFFVNEERVQGICREILRRGLSFKWAAQGRADRVASLSDETFALLKQSGFTVFHVGAESGSDAQLEQVSKRSSRQTTIDCARAVKAHGLHISFGFIFGFPGETEADIQQNFSLMEEVTDIQGSYDCIYHFYAPSPGSPMLEASVQRGAEDHPLLEDWIGYNTSRGITSWVDAAYIDRIRWRTDFVYAYARPNFMLRQRLAGSPARRLLYYPLHVINRLRYRLKFYAFPLDWWIYRTLRGVW